MGNGAVHGTGSKQDDSQEDNNNIIICLECTFNTQQLECGHRFCRKCILDMVVDHVTIANTGTNTFPCQTCGSMCQNPAMSETKIINGTPPVDHDVSSTDETQKPTTPTPTPKPDVKIPTDDYICQREESKAKLMWTHQHDCNISDVTFLYDRTLLYVSSPADPDDYQKTLNSLNAKGTPEEPPLPDVLTSPQSVKSSQDGRTVTVLDRIDGDENVIFVFRNKPKVDCWIQADKLCVVVMQWLDLVAPVSEDQIACTTYVGNLVTTFDISGKSLWKYGISAEMPNIEGKCIDAYHDGTLAVSRPRTAASGGGVILLDKDGDVIRTLSTELITNPYCLCFTSRGHILVADWGSRSVLLCCVDGVIVRKVLTLEKEPSSLAVHNNDRYIAVVYADNTIDVHCL